MLDNYRQFVYWRTSPASIRSAIITTPFTNMPFSSINWTVLKCTDTLTPVQLWDFLAFAKLWLYLISAKAQSILLSCLLFLIPKPPLFLARYSSGSVHSSARWFLPYQVQWGSNVGTVRQLVSVPEDEYQTVTPSLHPVSYYPSPCLTLDNA